MISSVLMKKMLRWKPASLMISALTLWTVELIMELEKEFDVQIPDEEAEKIVTVGDAVAFIEKAQK